MFLPTTRNIPSLKNIVTVNQQAHDALESALELLRNTVPDIDDFDSDKVYGEAVEDHIERVHKVRITMLDLECIVDHCNRIIHK